MADDTENSEPIANHDVDANEDRVAGDGPAAIGILILTILFIVLIVVAVI